MAKNYSEIQLAESYKNFYGVIYPLSRNALYKKVLAGVLHRIYPILVFFLNFKKKLLLFFSYKKTIFAGSYNKIDLRFSDQASRHLKEKGWCFIENFIDDLTYNNVLKNWPNKNHFILNDKSSRSIYHFSNSKNLINHQYLNYLYNYIRGESAKSKISKFLGKNDESFECKHISFSIVKENNFLVPHIDGISKNNLNKMNFNFIVFFDGNNKNTEYSGATGFYEDNEFKKPIFIPHNMKNTCIVYDSSDRFYHGFKKVNKDGHRKVMSFQFIHKDVNY